MVGVNNDSNVCPKDISPFNIIQSEKLVEKAISVIAGFVNPFEVDGGLICLSSENNGWKLSERGRLEIKWCDGDIFPNEIVDILSKDDAVQDSDDDQDSVASHDID
ncbi:hypothetical protein ElyMa_001949300 [Elysia marginata]|uniref:Uncharacterized protein n=1 Tax=Elysia marginata TaxID=1093978 RepID=A0AAV4EYK6_9GAST|nr:hypothetical protein ElyMa_001949300 [Elysia marginata]